MEADYYEVTSELDAREILRYLNHLGIHNITGEVLKHFITDLKKLIKYDLERTNEKSEEKFEFQWPERLHSASTFCSRTRSKTSDGAVLSCSRECQHSRTRKPFNIRNVHSAPNIGQYRTSPEDKPLRRACSCVRVERKPDIASKDSKVTTVSHSLIKVPKQPVMKKCDPVSLYHYYTMLWAKYKPNVPGENDWADLRWRVRQQMAGCIPNPTRHKSSEEFRYKDAGQMKGQMKK